MASGFKTATVTAAKVPSTQTNFPAYVDLSRLGITTLAEAQSVRVYAEEAKTTEWAREIVDVKDMWVKIPSLTSTTTIYVDWDGVRSDHSISGTYGRNNVWTGFSAVFHLKEGTGTSTTNSAGGTGGTLSTSALWGTNSRFGSANGLTSNGSGYVSTGISGTWSNYTVSHWRYVVDPSGTQNASHFSSAQQTPPNNIIWNYFDDGNPSTQESVYREYRAGSHQLILATESKNAWQYNVQTSQKNTTNGFKAYRNASLLGQANTANADIAFGSVTLALMGNNTTGTFTGNKSTGSHFHEFRITTSILSSDWITTEYNNQVDEATFWGTWTDLGGGGGAVAPQFLGFAGL